MNRKLVVKRASLPYYKPFVIIDLETNKVVKHCKTEQEANKYLQLYLDGIIATPLESPQQPQRYDPLLVANDKMQNNCIDPCDVIKPVINPILDRKIEI